MKNYRMFIYIALLLSGLMVFGTGIARATAILPSDIISVTFDGGTPITRGLNEVKGESVTEEIDVHFADPNNLLNGGIVNNTVFLVEPTGATFVGLDPAGVSLYSGKRSDKINIHLNKEAQSGGDALSFTMNSDQDPGPNEVVTGYLEAGVESPVNITRGIINADTWNILTSTLGHTITVTAASDAGVEKVPEPATLILLGLGLLGIVAVGRKMRSVEK